MGKSNWSGKKASSLQKKRKNAYSMLQSWTCSGGWCRRRCRCRGRRYSQVQFPAIHLFLHIYHPPAWSSFFKTYNSKDHNILLYTFLHGPRSYFFTMPIHSSTLYSCSVYIHVCNLCEFHDIFVVQYNTVYYTKAEEKLNSSSHIFLLTRACRDDAAYQTVNVVIYPCTYYM